jgi:hypothetical protein
MKLLCALDVDGVLADFDKAARIKHGLPITKEYPYTIGEWINFTKETGIPEDEWWGAFDYDFWESMPWTEDGKEILSVVEGRFGIENIMILTACPTRPQAYAGKFAWILKNIPQYRRRCLIGNYKVGAASFNHVLVDDSEMNVDDFKEGGGLAILVPRMWNKLHAENTIEYLKDAFWFVQNKEK